MRDIGEQLLRACLAPDPSYNGLGCDNMTLMIVLLLRDGLTEERLRERCGLPPPVPFLAQKQFSAQTYLDDRFERTGEMALVWDMPDLIYRGDDLPAMRSLPPPPPTAASDANHSKQAAPLGKKKEAIA